MRSLLLSIALAGLSQASSVTDRFITHAQQKHGDFAHRAAQFLVEHMPDSDRETLGFVFLMQNLDFAVTAREVFPWAKEVPEEIFMNDVLPYAVFDEPRDPWRKEFYKLAKPMVKDAKSASEAAQILNRDFFKKINTHYNRERKRTNQSPKESMEQGMATCTGLSIILVDVCRAVGIPARAVGIPLWADGSGNHTWVEIWDNGWHFMGADEFNKKGLNHGWFVKKAGLANEDVAKHAIYATSWKMDGLNFPMVWAPHSQTVGAVNVTERYVKAEVPEQGVGVRLRESGQGDTRVAASGQVTSADGKVLKHFKTKAGRSDLNDVARMVMPKGVPLRLRFKINGQWLESQPLMVKDDNQVVDVMVGDLKPVAKADVAAAKDGEDDREFTKEQSKRVVKFLAGQVLAQDAKQRSKELKDRSITQGDKTMKWLEKTFGEEPKDGRSLWISMHGGGGAPHAVNEKQWQNQIRLYQPEEGIYLAPRAPTNTWNLWHQPHIDPMFSRLIESMVMLRGVNPEKVYLMGYSAGGDGVWQLAPRMADRFAAASMMAGHPNESKLDGLRNLPFGLFMGGNDHAHKRNKVAEAKAAELKKLDEADSGGYTHMSRIYKGMGHWMKLKDAESVPWMAKFTRRTWPEKIVWYQDNVTHDRFYWLQVPEGTAEKGKRIVAEVKGQNVTLTGDVPKGIQLLLNDAWIDIDRPIMVSVNGEKAKTYKTKRSSAVVRNALRARLDPSAAPTAVVVVE